MELDRHSWEALCLDYFHDTYKRFAADDRVGQINKLFELHGDTTIDAAFRHFSEKATTPPSILPDQDLTPVSQKLGFDVNSKIYSRTSREKLASELIYDLRMSQSIVIVGHQGLGKSTLVTRIAAETKNGHDRIVHIDFYETPKAAQNRSADHMHHLMKMLEFLAIRIGATLPSREMQFARKYGYHLDWLLEEKILPQIAPGKLILILENLHLLFGSNQGEDIFGKLRAWCTPSTIGRSIRILGTSSLPAVYASEDIHRSPLNVCAWHELPELLLDEMQESLCLSWPNFSRHESEQLAAWIGGNPTFLNLIINDLGRTDCVTQLMQCLYAGNLPPRLLSYINKTRDLLETNSRRMHFLRSAIRSESCDWKSETFKELLAMGIIRHNKCGRADLRYRVYESLLGGSK